MNNEKNLRTEALVLKRINYGEADRILSIITPEGKKSVLAKGVRKEKSKLAGGIEMFCLSEVVIYKARGDLAILTAARLKQYYKNILGDFSSLEVASEILKKVSIAAETNDNHEFFDITKQCLEALDEGANTELVMSWFYFNLARVSGEQVNLLVDINGEKLEEGEKYTWDVTEKALKKEKAGKISTNEIKMMRLMLIAELKLILKVEEATKMAPEILFIAKAANQI